MPFIKCGDHYININHVMYVKEQDEVLQICFQNTLGQPVSRDVLKSAPEGKDLLRLLTDGNSGN